MPRLRIQGHEINASTEVLLTWAMGVFPGSFEIVGRIYLYQQMGNSNFGWNAFSKGLQNIVDQLEQNDKFVDEKGIQEAIDAMLPAIRHFIDSSSLFCEWHEKHLTREMLKKHEEMNSRTGSFTLPDWINTQEYQTCLEGTSSAYSAYLDGLEVSIRNIEDIYSKTDFDQYYDELRKARCQIPDARMMIDVGFAEAIRRKADQFGGVPSV